jgi:hypothetical protein
VSPETGNRPPETQNVDAQTTFTLEIAVRVRNLSRKRASNLQRGKYQDLIRGSLESASQGVSIYIRSGISLPDRASTS